MSISPTNQQASAIEHPYNKVITARPGSGKTFTIAQMIVNESEDLLSYQGVVAISYTRKASDELKTRCNRYGAVRNKSFFGTIDSFCLNEIVGPFLGRYLGCSVELEIVNSVDYNSGEEYTEEDLIDALKVGRLPINMLCSAAVLILNYVKAAEVYITARYKSVYVDEYQDCGQPQHNLVMRLCSMGLKTVVVGDLDQAIFGWAGKSSEHLNSVISSTDFKHFVLTKNHRCHPSIINYSLRVIGHPDALLPTDDLRVFRVQIKGSSSSHDTDLSGTDESSMAHTIEVFLPKIKERYGIENYNDIAILARSNATLDRFQSALTVPSKRYISSTLDAGFSKWRHLFARLLETYFSPSRFADDFLDDYFNHFSTSSARIKARRLVTRYLSLAPDELFWGSDLAVKIADACEPHGRRDDDITIYKDVTSDLNCLTACYKPPADNEINLLTYHKAKGLEFDAVFCLETYEYVMPPGGCKETDTRYKDALSLHYVGLTRARKVCYIPMATLRHNSRGELWDAKPSRFLEHNGVRQLRVETKW